jgi:hypothetical protein
MQLYNNLLCIIWAYTRQDSNENLDSFIGKDIWFLKNRLYISQNFCNNCCEWNWFLEVFNAKEKTKKMLLELFTPNI